jgi:hypothetical protein
MLVENWVSIVANKKKVIALDSNPSWTGKRPYILTTPLPMRGSPWGREIIYAAKPLQLVLNAIYNLMIDSTTFGVIPACTVNKNKLDPDEDFDSLTPGAVYHVTGDGRYSRENRDDAVEAMPMIQSFEAKIDESTMMYGTLAGEPPLKGRSTATQYRGEVSQGRSAASILAHGLQKRDLEPAVQLAYENILQYLSDISDPKLQEAFSTFMGPSSFLDEWNRYRLLNAKFQVRARGISNQMEKEDQLQKLMQLSTTAQMLQMPFDVAGGLAWPGVIILTALRTKPTAADDGSAQGRGRGAGSVALARRPSPLRRRLAPVSRRPADRQSGDGLDRAPAVG